MPAKPDTTTATGTDAILVIEVAPIDPGDAPGVGNTTRAAIRPDLLHETAEETEARLLAWMPAGVR